MTLGWVSRAQDIADIRNGAERMSDGVQEGTQPILGGGPSLSERIFAATGSDAPPDWTDRQKEQWLICESRRQLAEASKTQAAGATQVSAAGYDRIWRNRQEKLGAHIQDLEHQREVLISYLKVKLHTEDWRGVADVAMDLRELDAEKKGMLVA